VRGTGGLPNKKANQRVRLTQREGKMARKGGEKNVQAWLNISKMTIWRGGRRGGERRSKAANGYDVRGKKAREGNRREVGGKLLARH